MSRLPLRVDDTTYKILRASPEAVALRTRAMEWMQACEADSLNNPDPGRIVRGTERTHRAMLDAALQFAEAVRKRGSEYLHLHSGGQNAPILFIPLTRDARSWIRAHGVDSRYALMVKFWGEQLTVRSPTDRRFKRTFGPREATWAKIETEADRVRYEKVIRG